MLYFTYHQKIQLIAAGILGAISISLAAYGAHGLHDKLLEASLLATFHKAVNYGMYHAIALTGVVALQHFFKRYCLVGYLWIVGTALFSGALFLHTVAGMHDIVFLTPIGGTLLIVGWLLLSGLTIFVPSKAAS